MRQTVDRNTSSKELERFLMVAEAYRHESGRRAFMPACPVDTEWHRILKQPDDYRKFCHAAVARDVLHEPSQGEGEIGWLGTYERLYGRLPEIWFRSTDGILDMSRRQKYLDTGVFYASWECNPY